MKILIVHAHHEPKSFCSALARRAEETFTAEGHTVEFADLYAEKFNPISDRKNFLTVKDPDYLKQQVEEAYASQADGFATDLEREIRRLEACDLLIFSYPLWWFGMPAILKGWVDRVFASGRIYGGGKFYSQGLGNAQKRAMILMTTGGGPDVYGGYGINPPMSTILAPVQHGVFWFNGFLPLAPFIAWSPAHIGQEARATYLESLETRLKNLGEEIPLVLPPESDFPNWGKDLKKRFMVTLTHSKQVDEQFLALVPAEGERIAELKRDGLVISFQMTPPDAQQWRGYLCFRAGSREEVEAALTTLPLKSYLNYEINELALV